MWGYQQGNKTRVKESYKYRRHCAQYHMTWLQIQTKIQSGCFQNVNSQTTRQFNILWSGLTIYWKLIQQGVMLYQFCTARKTMQERKYSTGNIRITPSKSSLWYVKTHIVISILITNVTISTFLYRVFKSKHVFFSMNFRLIQCNGQKKTDKRTNNDQ
jgi:hypothetical protein